MNSNQVNILWLRRDLRLFDNKALSALSELPNPILPVFIFDDDIIDELPEDDARISFIHEQLSELNANLHKLGSGIRILKGNPLKELTALCVKLNVANVYCNEDYEPYAIARDEKVKNALSKVGVGFEQFKDQVIFHKDEVVKADGSPYTVFTPYSKVWKALVTENTFKIDDRPVRKFNWFKFDNRFPWLSDLGFKLSTIQVPPHEYQHLSNYRDVRNIPSVKGTSRLSVHLRFGTVSIRKITAEVSKINEQLLNELIWREFFMQILWHYPHVVEHNFRRKYDVVQWENNHDAFEKWCRGETGYPLVDAGMRQLNTTGWMHNRVRMVVASFLCKHLLIDWRWGEAYFAEKLLDYDLAINNGNWQWAAGTGCDAAPYFRVFNPTSQTERFDPKFTYINEWVKDLNELTYPTPIVEHKFARNRALERYKNALTEFSN